MKQNITLSLDKDLLKQPRALAAESGSSVSGLLGAKLAEMVKRDEEYARAKAKAIEFLKAPPFDLGGEGIPDRDALYDRQSSRKAMNDPEKLR